MVRYLNRIIQTLLITPACCMYHETSETVGTVGTVFSPKNGQNNPKNAVITSVLSLFLPQKCLFSHQKRLKNTDF